MKEEYTFEGQRADEEIIFVVKQHPWVLAGSGFLAVGIVVLLVLSILIFGFSGITSIIIIGILLFALIYGFRRWFSYSNYLYILTNQRIIIIEQHGFFSRKIIEAELDKVQNVTVEVKGMMKTVFNFGNIVLRTAGMDPVIVLQNIENPYGIQEQIIKHSKKLATNLENKNKNIIR